jgi:hypothetical protein
MNANTKPENFRVIVELIPPGTSKRYPQGKVGEFYFTFVDGLVTINDINARALQDDHGKEYTRKLDDGATHADAHSAAHLLYGEFRRTVLGLTPETERVRRPLNYPNRGWC